MPRSTPPRHRRRLLGRPLVLLAVVAATVPGRGAAQTPAIKATVLGLDAFRCPAPGEVVVPSEEEARQAAQLGATARQAVILGDVERARGLLARAVSLDSRSSTLAYQYGRVLEDLGQPREAVLQYCRVLDGSGGGEDAVDAQARVEAYADENRRRIAAPALEAFGNGVAAAGEGRWAAAEENFLAASAAHADFPEAEFNRAVALESLGRGVEAADAYRAYLDLRPDAPDAIRVSERIGQLQVVPGSLPSPGSALALGMLLPGGGQFYTGRPLGGILLLAAAGGAAAAGFLIEETDVRCLRAVEPGQSCPPDQIVGQTTSQPYLTWGLVGAGAVILGGAVEAFLHARGMDEVEVATLGGGARLLGPSVQARGLGADVRFFRVTF